MSTFRSFGILVVIVLLAGCAADRQGESAGQFQATAVKAVSPDAYRGYQPIDPQYVPKVDVFSSASNSVAERYWGALSDEDKRMLLPIQSAEVSVQQTDLSGNVSYLVASVSGATGSYSVVMDYMKYRVEKVVDDNDAELGTGRVGVGLRIKAQVTTNKANLNLGGLLPLGVEAAANNLSGSISAEVIGIDSQEVTNLIPLTSQIDQTSIQNALQALAAVKAKIWETDTKITPHLVAISQRVPGSSNKIMDEIKDE